MDGSCTHRYVTAVDAAAAFANVHGCQRTPTPLATPYDGGSINFACTEHPDCTSGVGAGKKAVVTCLYDGGHSVPPGRVAEGITWWFLSQFMPKSSLSDGGGSSNSTRSNHAAAAAAHANGTKKI